MKIKKIHNDPTQQKISKAGFNRLDKILLNEKNQQVYDMARKNCDGPKPWQFRKHAETYDLLALSQISKRLKIKEIDLRDSFRAIVVMDTPVMLQPDKAGKCRMAKDAILGLMYREEAVTTQQPGTSFVSVLAPNQPWYANIGRNDLGQPLCLGLTLPAAIPIKEIVLLTYGALSMQFVMLDEQDSAGVLNPEAAKWWQQNLDKIPLTSEPFIRLT